MSEDLATYLGLDAREVFAGGRTLTVRPLSLRQIPGVARALRPLAPVLAAGLDLLSLAEHLDDVVAALAAATGEPPDWLWGIAPEELLALAGAVVEVNADFFSRRLAPALVAATARLPGAPADGAAPSPGS
jgi:hypothetical protein